MGHDEHEMLVEYSEMTAFNFNSREYQEVRKDLIECKEKVKRFERIWNNLKNAFRWQAV